MERKLSYVVVQEEDAFVARCLDVEVASDGAIEAEAVAALKEALELYFEDHMETLSHLLVWTGRGRQPKWVAEFLSAGGTIEQLAI
ncbi:MAG: H-NS family nucleoid-associated regulatory protein [Azonexus sp.]|nr:H-NS family nucleoid-associated regulatory protein [Azonexus sp.]